MKNSIKRLIGITSILAMALSVMVLPAAAAPPLASANLAAADRLLKAGETHDFVINFQSNEAGGGLIGPLQPAGQTIDAIQIATPGSILDWGSVTAPATIGNFDVFVDDPVGRITLHNGTLAPGASLSIPFTATVLTTMSGDKSNGFFGVQASASNDPNFGNVTGNLTSIVDILAVNSIALTQPASVEGFESSIQTGVTDNTVTANQSNVSVDVNVSNNSSTTPKDVTVTLTGVPGSPQVTVPEVGPSSSATATFSNVAFGSSNTTLDASLTAANADREAGADPAQVPVTVQAAPSLGKGSDISPDYVGLGSHLFSVSLNKQNPPAALFDATLTTVRQGTTTAGPTADVLGKVVGRNGQNVVLDLRLDFGNLVNGQPVFPGGTYDATLTIADAIDDNGKTFALEPIDVGDIFFDPLAPVFNLLRFAGQAPVAGTRDAVTHNEAFSYNLTLHNDGASGSPCTQCPVLVEVFDANNPETVYASATPTTNNSGQASGNLSGTWPNLSHIDVKMRATATDRGGNSTPAEAIATENGAQDGTSPVKVSMIDTLPPAIDPASPDTYSKTRITAYTGGYDDLTQTGVQRPQNRSWIDVVFDEPIARTGQTPVSPQNWTVTGKMVSSSEVVTFGDGQQGIRLTLSSQLGRNERPAVSYARNASLLLSSNIVDRVEQPLVNGAVQTVIDAILPTLPTLDLVDGQARYSDSIYHTNLGHYTGARNDDLTPNEELVLLFGNVEGGATVVVRQAGTASELARVENTSTQEIITQEIRIPRSDIPGRPDTGATSLLNLEIFATDSAGNVSPLGTDTINLDLDAPGSTGITVDTSANAVTATADEDLRFGRNEPIDWAVGVTWDGDSFLFQVESVSNGSTLADRVLQVSSGLTPLANVDSVDFARMSYIGSDAEGRLRDPAGNRLPLVLNFNNGG